MSDSAIEARSAQAETGLSGGAGSRRWGETLHFAVRNPKLLAGAAVVLGLLLLGLVGPMAVGDEPNAYVGPQSAPPSGEYWLGTTSFGQDVWAQFVHGVRATFLVGLVGGGMAALVGMVVGFTAGYRGGLVDEVLNMITNIVLVLPALVVLIIAAAYLEARGIWLQGFFIGLTSWPWVARAVRAQTLSLATRDFVDLARMSGRRSYKIIFREIAPNMSSYLFMTFILLFGGAILIAAGLDFIGLGPTEGVSLGLMMHSAVSWSALSGGLWWWFVPPGLGITAIVGSLYIMNVGLDEVFNPRLREL
ncbi:ABC transporter permease [Streptomonospora litoralis]|uniref:Oligopeptide transport system permease protein OppC n=1 Tax=Streptomonospora litoralis TaxID=2498135 RepID=A0A4P6Q6D6_9ACTN|nr:ABC transporter permease [Streptomonospora litoralis]QBI54474.1 Oligopeptide transport system permease protein OppC [Streptomonospora litoralis]